MLVPSSNSSKALFCLSVQHGGIPQAGFSPCFALVHPAVECDHLEQLLMEMALL
jgi:hypothetical protein